MGAHKMYVASLTPNLQVGAIPTTSPPVNSSAPAFTTGDAGTAYSSALIATGGTTPYTFSILAGGTGISPLTLNASTGLISGTLPNFATTITFKAGVKDSSNPQLSADTGVVLCSITVRQPNIGCVLTPGGYKK